MNMNPSATSTLKFPSKAAWKGNLEIFRMLLSDRSECPESFAFAAALAMISLVVHGKVYIQYGRKTYLNVFLLLLGAANDSHKGQAISLVSKLTEALGLTKGQEPAVEVIRSLDSGEGFIERFPPSGRVLVLIDEVASLFRKGKTESSTIIPTLNTAYDGAELTRNTVKKRIRVGQPYVVLLGGTNPGLVEDIFKLVDVASGFLGRFIVFHGQRERLVAWPEPTGPRLSREVITFLQSVVKRYASPVRMELSPDAHQFWENYYRLLNEEIARTSDVVLGELWKRVHLNTVKIAGLLACAEEQCLISLETLQRAGEISLYAAKSAEILREHIGKSPERSIEDRIVAYLSSCGTATKRQIQQHVRGRDLRAETFNRILDNMVKCEVVKVADGIYSLSCAPPPGATVQHVQQASKKVL